METIGFYWKQMVDSKIGTDIVAGETKGYCFIVVKVYRAFDTVSPTLMESSIDHASQPRGLKVGNEVHYRPIFHSGRKYSFFSLFTINRWLLGTICQSPVQLVNSSEVTRIQLGRLSSWSI